MAGTARSPALCFHISSFLFLPLSSVDSASLSLLRLAPPPRRAAPASLPPLLRRLRPLLWSHFPSSYTLSPCHFGSSTVSFAPQAHRAPPSEPAPARLTSVHLPSFLAFVVAFPPSDSCARSFHASFRKPLPLRLSFLQVTRPPPAVPPQARGSLLLSFHALSKWRLCVARLRPRHRPRRAFLSHTPFKLGLLSRPLYPFLFSFRLRRPTALHRQRRPRRELRHCRFFISFRHFCFAEPLFHERFLPVPDQASTSQPAQALPFASIPCSSRTELEI